MTETNAAIAPEPVLLVSGQLAIYDDRAAGNGYALMFLRDGQDEAIRPQLPGMVVPILAKVLAGEDLTEDDIPGGPVMRTMLSRIMPVLSGEGK